MSMPPLKVRVAIRKMGFRVHDWEPVDEEKWLGYDPVLRMAVTVCLATGKACIEILTRKDYMEVEL